VAHHSFDVHYALWFEVPHVTAANSGGAGAAADGMSLRDLVRCAVVSQHLELVLWLTCEALRQHIFDVLSCSDQGVHQHGAVASAGEHNTCLIATALNMAMTLCLKHAAAKAQHWVVHHTAASSSSLQMWLCSVLQSTKSVL